MTDSVLAWLDLEQRILKAGRAVEAEFAAVNLAHTLVPYRQAALWDRKTIALSGAATVSADAPFVLWLDKVIGQLNSNSPKAVTADDLPGDLAAHWRDWLPAHGLLIPVGAAALLFVRDEPFIDDDVQRLERLADLLRVTRAALSPRRMSIGMPRGRKAWVAWGAAVVLSFLPVTSSVLAPAECVPANPVVIRAPLDGVVDRVHIQPNEPVMAGQPLYSLDSTTLAGRLDMARQGHAIAEAEYRQAAQAMVFDAKAKVQAAILAGKVEERAAEVRLLEGQMSRIEVKAPRGGIAVFDDAADWIGRPVTVGEKVMALADEKEVEVEAWLSVSDVGEVRIDGTLTLFLNARPLSPLKARIRSIAYEATARPDSTIAHRVRAVLASGETPRLGLKGTARIDGDTVPLVWWVFRRPLATLRQFLGF